MKRIITFISLLLLSFSISAQTPSFRLHIQAGKPELQGDGDDYTTLVVTARDAEGGIITTMNGKVVLRSSAGFLDEFELKMENGVAYTKYTAPIFGQPIKTAQRMIFFTVKFIRKFMSGFGGSTNQASNQRLASKIALETIKEGDNPFALIPGKNNDDYAYFVCEMNGVKGKTKIHIVKATEGGNSSIMPGYYTGSDVTGQAPVELLVEGGGRGEMTQGGSESNSILFTNEPATELNNLMIKSIGGGGFMNAYLGVPQSQEKYVENYDIKKMGMPSFYLPMPKNGIFIYIPPILLEYRGRPKESAATGSPASAGQQEQREKTFIAFQQNELIGDGRSTTKVVFHYETEKGVPVSGKPVTWSIPKEIQVLSSETVTNANGDAVAVIKAPILRANGEERGENTRQIINNYDLFKVTVTYASPKRQNDYVEGLLSVYKTIEKNIRILKPGFETKPLKVLLPQVEQYTLQGNIYAMVEMANSTSLPEKLNVSDAVIFVDRQKFDQENFNKDYEYYFKKDRQTFMNVLDDPKGGFMAVTDKSGNFKLKIGGGSDRIFVLEPLQGKISFLNSKRQGALTDVLALFEDPAFSTQVLEKLFNINKELCSSEHQNSVYLEEKLHVLGTLMTNTNGTARYMRDCAANFSQQSWEAFKYVFFLAAEKFKWNERLGKWASNTETGKKLADAGITADKYLWNEVAGQNTQNGTYSMVYRFLFNSVTRDKVAATQEYYRLLGSSANYVLVKKEKKMMDAVANAVVKYLPYPGKLTEMFIAMYYGDQKEEIAKLLNQDLVKLHTVYEKLQPALVDRSTQIRQHYQDMASWRLDLEMFKAYKDLTTELVAKGAIIIVDAATGNYVSIKSHLDMLSNANKALDAAYITSRLVIEFQNYRNLWAESDASLFYANRCIEQGTLNPVAQDSDLGFSLFPSAMAAETPVANPLRGVPTVTANQLSLSGGNLPAGELNKFYNGYPEFENWFVQNDEKLLWLSVAAPDEFAGIIRSRETYSDDLRNITVLALGITENPADIQLKKQWEELAGKLAGSSSLLVKDAMVAADKMNKMPVNPTVGSPEAVYGKAIGKKWLIYGGAGLAGILVILAIVILLRRKRKTAPSLPLPTAPSLPLPAVPTPALPIAPPLVRPVAPAPPPAVDPTPKFCPQCGTPFKPGAKFCGKCGYKTM